MDFHRTHQTIAYLLVGTGFLVLYLSGELPPLFWALCLPPVALAPIYGGGKHFGSTSLWNTILIAALGGLFALAISTGDWLRYAIYFASLMVIARLWQVLTTRDYYQLYALSFLQLVAGAVINPTLSFAICFLFYVVFLTWALVLLHLRRDMDRLAAEEGEVEPEAIVREGVSYGNRRMRQLIGPGFLAGTSALALVIFASSVIVFLFFPRLGLGFFGQHEITGTQVSGFNESGTQLGHFGRLKLDQTVIARVEIEGITVQEALPLRLRGISFDQYEANAWSKSDKRKWQVAATLAEGFHAIRQWGYVPDDSVQFTQRVFLEHLRIGRKTVFGEARVVAVRDLLSDRYTFNPRNRTRFYVDDDEDVSYRSRSGTAALRYEVKSVRVQRKPDLLRTASARLHGSLHRYLQLPDDLDPRVRELAQEIAGDLPTHFDKAAAVERHLVRQYGYSLEGGHDDEEPLSDFLFSMKKGHCEYFATAMVVLLRAQGVPARYVGGFYGGEHNDVGDYIAVRQADAHAWVEVFFQGYGWVVFDPTPPSGSLVGAGQGFFAELGRAFDSLELLWYKWVIRWDLERQVEFLRGIGRQIARVGDLFPETRGLNLKEDTKPWMLGIAVGVLVLVLLIANHRRIRALLRGDRKGPAARSDRDGRLARKLYARLLRLSARRGVDVQSSTSAGRIAREVPGAAPVIRVYQDVVFGGEALAEGSLREAHEHLRQLERAS